MNKPVYFRLSILELFKKLMFWYGYEKLKNEAKLYYMDTDSLYT